MFANVDPAVTITIVAALLGPVGAYMIAARRMSGKIGNSDAEQLWAESKAIRDWSSHKIDAYERQVKSLQEEHDTLSERCSALEAENNDLKSQLITAKDRINELIELVSEKKGGQS